MPHGESVAVGCQRGYRSMPSGTPARLSCYLGAYAITYSEAAKCVPVDYECPLQCSNRGECRDRPREEPRHTCYCKKEYTGENCETKIKCSLPAIALDASRFEISAHVYGPEGYKNLPPPSDMRFDPNHQVLVKCKTAGHPLLNEVLTCQYSGRFDRTGADVEAMLRQCPHNCEISAGTLIPPGNVAPPPEDATLSSGETMHLYACAAGFHSTKPGDPLALLTCANGTLKYDTAEKPAVCRQATCEVPARARDDASMTLTYSVGDGCQLSENHTVVEGCSVQMRCTGERKFIGGPAEGNDSSTVTCSPTGEFDDTAKFDYSCKSSCEVPSRALTDRSFTQIYSGDEGCNLSKDDTVLEGCSVRLECIGARTFSGGPEKWNRFSTVTCLATGDFDDVEKFSHPCKPDCVVSSDGEQPPFNVSLPSFPLRSGQTMDLTECAAGFHSSSTRSDPVATLTCNDGVLSYNADGTHAKCYPDDCTIPPDVLNDDTMTLRYTFVGAGDCKLKSGGQLPMRCWVTMICEGGRTFAGGPDNGNRVSMMQCQTTGVFDRDYWYKCESKCSDASPVSAALRKLHLTVPTFGSDREAVLSGQNHDLSCEEFYEPTRDASPKMACRDGVFSISISHAKPCAPKQCVHGLSLAQNSASALRIAIPDNPSLLESESIPLNCSSDSFDDPPSSDEPIATLACVRGNYKFSKQSSSRQCSPLYCEGIPPAIGVPLDADSLSASRMTHNDSRPVQCATGYVADPDGTPASVTCSRGIMQLVYDDDIECLSECSKETGAALTSQDQDRAADALLDISHSFPTLIAGRSSSALFCVENALQFVSGELDKTKDSKNPPARLECAAGSYSLVLNDNVTCHPERCSDQPPALDPSKHLSASVEVGAGLPHDESLAIGCAVGYVADPSGDAATLRCSKGEYSIDYSDMVKCEPICDDLSAVQGDVDNLRVTIPDGVKLHNPQLIDLQCDGDSFQEPSVGAAGEPPATLECGPTGEYEVRGTAVRCHPNLCSLGGSRALADVPEAHLDVADATRRIADDGDLSHDGRFDMSCAEGFAAVPTAEVPAQVVCKYGSYRIEQDKDVRCYENDCAACYDKPRAPVCDMNGQTEANLCHLVNCLHGTLAYTGACLNDTECAHTERAAEFRNMNAECSSNLNACSVTCVDSVFDAGASLHGDVPCGERVLQFAKSCVEKKDLLALALHIPRNSSEALLCEQLTNITECPWLYTTDDNMPALASVATHSSVEYKATDDTRYRSVRFVSRANCTKDGINVFSNPLEAFLKDRRRNDNNAELSRVYTVGEVIPPLRSVRDPDPESLALQIVIYAAIATLVLVLVVVAYVCMMRRKKQQPRAADRHQDHVRMSEESMMIVDEAEAFGHGAGDVVADDEDVPAFSDDEGSDVEVFMLKDGIADDEDEDEEKREESRSRDDSIAI